MVNVIPLTNKIREATISLLEASPEMYAGISMNPAGGIVLHIPFTGPVQPRHRLYDSGISELYLFLEHEEKPKALIFFASGKHPIIVVLRADADGFLKEVGLHLDRVPDRENKRRK